MHRLISNLKNRPPEPTTTKFISTMPQLLIDLISFENDGFLKENTNILNDILKQLEMYQHLQQQHKAILEELKAALSLS